MASCSLKAKRPAEDKFQAKTSLKLKARGWRGQEPLTAAESRLRAIRKKQQNVQLRPRKRQSHSAFGMICRALTLSWPSPSCALRAGLFGSLTYDSDPSGGEDVGEVVYPKRCPEPVPLWINTSGRINCFR